MTDKINQPSHYYIGELETIDMICSTLTKEQLYGYYLGNIIKYRIRAGKKDQDPTDDLNKAKVYEEWLNDLDINFNYDKNDESLYSIFKMIENMGISLEDMFSDINYIQDTLKKLINDKGHPNE